MPRTICRARTTETVFHGLKTSLAGVAKAKTQRRRFTSEWEETPPELGGRHNVAKECCSWRRTNCVGFEHTAVELYAYTNRVSAFVKSARIVHCMHLFPFCTWSRIFDSPLGKRSRWRRAPDTTVSPSMPKYHERTQEFSSQRPSAPTRRA